MLNQAQKMTVSLLSQAQKFAKWQKHEYGTTKTYVLPSLGPPIHVLNLYPIIADCEGVLVVDMLKW